MNLGPWLEWPCAGCYMNSVYHSLITEVLPSLVRCRPSVSKCSGFSRALETCVHIGIFIRQLMFVPSVMELRCWACRLIFLLKDDISEAVRRDEAVNVLGNTVEMKTFEFGKFVLISEARSSVSLATVLG